jgi:hypothetical protein
MIAASATPPAANIPTSLRSMPERGVGPAGVGREGLGVTTGMPGGGV